MGLKFSKKDKVEELRVRQLPTIEDKDEIVAVLTDEPDNAIANLDYGVYLSHIEKNYDLAEQYLAYAVECDPLSAKCIGFYALFLELEKKNFEKAGELYKKGYDMVCKIQVLGEDEVNFMCNYAIFQKNAMKNPQKAEEYYLRLIASNPNHAIAHGDYGILLSSDLKEYDRADHHFKRAAELEPNVAHWQLAYGNFLKDKKKDKKAAKQYYTAAKEAKLYHKQMEKEKIRKEKERIKAARKAFEDDD